MFAGKKKVKSTKDIRKPKVHNDKTDHDLILAYLKVSCRSQEVEYHVEENLGRDHDRT